MLDGKQIKLIQKLVEMPVIDKHSLSSSLNITSRQIEYLIDKINDNLSFEKLSMINYDGVFVSVPSETYEYLLHLTNVKNLSPEKYIFDKEERQALLFLFLINGGIVNINELALALDVSISTLHKDLTFLKKQLKDWDLSLNYAPNKGYRILGTENNVRSRLNALVADRIANSDIRILNWFYQTVQSQNIDDIKKLIIQLSKKYRLTFVENRREQFIYTFIADLTRIYEDPSFTVDALAEDELEELSEWKFANELLSHFNVKSKASSLYVTLITLCSTIGGETKFPLDIKVKTLNELFVSEFINISGISFSNRKQISDQIYTHFRSMYFRLKYNFPIYNPLTEQVQEVYSDVFSLVKNAAKILVDEIGPVPNSEVAFLTIHLISFIYENNNAKKHNFTAAIVCPNGIGTSTLLYIQLTGLFPELDFLQPFQYEEFKNKLDQVDIIFTTFYKTELFAKGKPCFIVNPVMSEEDKIKLSQKVKDIIGNTHSLTIDNVMRIVKNNIEDDFVVNQIGNELIKEITPNNFVNIQKNENKLVDNNLVDILDEKIILLNQECTSARDAIKLSGNIMLNRGYFDSNYLYNVIENHSYDSYDNYIIAPQIALPHTRPENGSLRVGLGITSLVKPIKFGNKFSGKVKYIFTLSAVDKTSHLKVLEDLMKLINNSQFFDLMDKGDKRAVIDFIVQVLKN